MQTVYLDVRGADGTVIDAKFCSDDSQPLKGVVIISHGFGEHAASYIELAQRLAQAGYASVPFNQRGHGSAAEQANSEFRIRNSELNDEGKGDSAPEERRGSGKHKDMRGIIPSYQCFLDDIRAVSDAAKKHAPDVPIALYGHSMGGNIVVNYLLEYDQSEYACAVLEAPWLGLYKEINPVVKGLAKVLGRLSPNIAIINKLSPEDLTSDTERVDIFRNDPRYHNRISMRMFSGINKGCEHALASASKLTIPIFLAYASNDRIVSNRAITGFYNNIRSIVTVKEYDSCHAIHNDKQRDILYKDIIDYLDEHTV